MCTAIYAAVVLVALIAGLTALRIKEGRSPNAELLVDLLNDSGDPARPKPADPDRPGPCPSGGRGPIFPRLRTPGTSC